MPNTVCHIEFDVTDIARSQSFYAALFGWSFRAFGDMVALQAGHIVRVPVEAAIGHLKQVEPELLRAAAVFRPPPAHSRRKSPRG